MMQGLKIKDKREPLALQDIQKLWKKGQIKMG